MTLLSAENISKKFINQVILEDVSFNIKQGDRIGLVGRNGIGKTTLFELLVGNMEVDSGSITKARSCCIDYITQDKTEHDESSLFDYVAEARADLLALHSEIHSLQDHLEAVPSDNAALTKLGQLQQQFETNGGFTFENEIHTILEGIGFQKERHRDRVTNFSGGEKNRAGLARALAGNGNLLLLDEPTNHLDIESTQWLEDYLLKTDRAVVVVSHDRAFLAAAIELVWEIQFAKLNLYVGGFEKYLVERAERRRLHEHRYKHQQEEIKRLEDFVRRNMAGQKTKQAQSKLKYLARIKRLPPLRADGPPPSIRMQSSGRSYALVLEAKDVTVGYGSSQIVKQVDFDIYRGDKIGLIGRNGSGKTTLLLSLIGELTPMVGDIRLGNNVDVAYFDQELEDLVSESTVLDSMWEVDPMVEIGKIRSFLARFGFTGEDCLKKVMALSGGEKTKLSMARLLYHPANFLIFDEPTNHLDIDSREVLEEALREYDGSCLIVSHDRHFLEIVTDRIFYVNDSKLTVYDGGYKYFREKQTAAMPEAKQKQVKSKEAFLTFKEKSKRQSRHKKAIQSTKSKITKLEKELASTEEDIRTNIPRSDWEQLNTASDKKQALEEQLLQKYAHLEELEGTKLD